MPGPAVAQIYRYRRASTLDSERQALVLATSSPSGQEHPYFFTGDLVRPQRIAKLLLALQEVVRARFHVPAAILERLRIQSDPVVTSSEERLRFEGFSSCCSAYARIDLHPAAVQGEWFGQGTTNVDFNPPMLSALARVHASDQVSLSVGRDRVELATEHDRIIEKKVHLPIRWLKGFVEVQAVQRRMTPMMEISGPEASRFIRALPRPKTGRHTMWLVPHGRSLRLSQVSPKGTAVRVGGLERLRVLERLVSRAQSLRIYADDKTGASGWVLVFDDSRFQLLLSPEVWRGFSGEGQALEAIADPQWRDTLKRVQAQLTWGAVVAPHTLARRSGIDVAVVERALAGLGSRGLVGYDLEDGAYFHRELPFDLGAVEKLQPRLSAARRLLSEGKVKVAERSSARIEVFVTSNGVEHRVRLSNEEARCTCPWYAKHQGARGPCKHILAARLGLEREDEQG